MNPADADRNAYRAAVSYWAMQHTFFDRASGVYREESRGAETARAWPYSQALAATLAMTSVPKRGQLYVRDAERRVSGLGGYLLTDGSFASALGPQGDVYYDDNEWIALELLRWYDLRSSPQDEPLRVLVVRRLHQVDAAVAQFRTRPSQCDQPAVPVGQFLARVFFVLRLCIAQEHHLHLWFVDQDRVRP